MDGFIAFTNRNRIKFFLQFVLFLFFTTTHSQNAMFGGAIQNTTDSVTVAASKKYIPNSFLRRVIMGNNYRKEWAQPVTIPVFRLSKSGLTIEELGGGMQTKSLQLEDKRGLEWAIRSVDKDARGAIPENIRNPFFVKVVQDMISAAHPYAALVVGQLAESAGIPAPKPVLYFIPDDPAFGEYRKVFANTLCFLEEREPTLDKTKAEDTEEVLEEIVEENDRLVAQKMVLKARLLDMLVADWDRHEDQWKWGVFDSANAKYYYAIPRDRDQAFFMSNGLLPKLAKLVAMRHINSFKWESWGLKRLNRKAWDFDKIFLNELDERMWQNTIKEFQAQLSDKAIERAVKKLPREIYALSGAMLENKLRSRRNTLFENAMKYYQFISGTVHVWGTAENEYFLIKKDADSIKVAVHRYSNGKMGEQIYQRSFSRTHTGIIYLEGLEGEDYFMVEDRFASKVKVKIKGGEGGDTYDLKNTSRVIVYDLAAEDHTISDKQGATEKNYNNL